MKRRLLLICCLLLATATAQANKPKQKSRGPVQQEFARPIARDDRRTEKSTAKARAQRADDRLQQKASQFKAQPSLSLPFSAASASKLQPVNLKAQLTSLRPPASRRQVDHRHLTVRANRSGYTIGTLFERNPRTNKPDKFTVKDVRGAWAYGYAGGDVRRNGWVLLDGLTQGRTPRPPAPRPPILTGDRGRAFLLKHYASAISRNRLDGDPVQLNRPTELWLNITPGGRAVDPVRQLQPGDPSVRFKGRYVTRDGRFMMGRVFGVDNLGHRNTPSRWGYIRRDSVSGPFGVSRLPPCCH